MLVLFIILLAEIAVAVTLSDIMWFCFIGGFCGHCGIIAAPIVKCKVYLRKKAGTIAYKLGCILVVVSVYMGRLHRVITMKKPKLFLLEYVGLYVQIFQNSVSPTLAPLQTVLFQHLPS